MLPRCTRNSGQQEALLPTIRTAVGALAGAGIAAVASASPALAHRPICDPITDATDRYNCVQSYARPAARHGCVVKTGTTGGCHVTYVRGYSDRYGRKSDPGPYYFMAFKFYFYDWLFRKHRCTGQARINGHNGSPYWYGFSPTAAGDRC
jgi:hypothetical protein